MSDDPIRRVIGARASRGIWSRVFAELLVSQQLSATDLATRLQSVTPPKLLDARETGEHKAMGGMTKP